MRNTHIYDSDLNPVLEKASCDDLAPLVGYIEKKFSQDLTYSGAYKAHSPEHTQYFDLIAKEIRDMGGNSFANLKRGQGPSYSEIVYDVGKKLKASVTKGARIEDNEAAVLEAILKKAFEQMTEAEKAELFDNLGDSTALSKGGMTSAALITLFRSGGFYSYQLTVIIANQIAKVILGRGLVFATNATLVRTASILAGPVGWAITGVWTAVDIAGPAFSVTIPSVVHIAMLRKSQQAVYCSSCKTMLVNDKVKFCPECGEKQ